MSCLIAEDDPATLRLVQRIVERAGFTTRTASDGQLAWEILKGPERPPLAILDWDMPGLEGVEVVRRLRASEVDTGTYTYTLLVTGRIETPSLVAALDQGADDYVRKPFDKSELEARLRAGRRQVELHRALQQKIHELEEASAHIQELQGLLPICMHCGKVRADEVWHKLEEYVASRLGTQISHALCESCMREHYGDLL